MRIIRRVIGALLLITALLVTQIPVVPASAAPSSDFQIDKTKLVKYTGTASSVTIPSSVKTIGAEAFAGNTSLTSISIGSNVTEIEYGAFKDCTYLSTIKLPESLLTLGNSVFSNNTSLKKITLPKNLEKIGTGVFAGCKNLTTIAVDKENPYFTFYKNGLYDKDKTILYSYASGSKETSYSMPDTVVDIKEYAFWGNDNLKEISFSTNLKEIPSYAFSNCRNLLAVSIPYSVKSIQSKAFENCISLQKVMIPASVSYLHSTAFDGCPKLVISADSGTVANEFYENWKLENNTGVDSGNETGDTVVDSGGNVYTVGSDGKLTISEKNDSNSVSSADALHDPSNVDYIPEFDPIAEDEEGVLGKTMVVGQNAVILMDSSVNVASMLNNRDVSEKEEAQKEAMAESEDTKGEALPKYAIVYDHISDYAYYGEGDLTTYTIPSNITRIGDFAFARSNLTSINIPKGVEEIGYAAFYHCDNLKEISIPSSVTWIEPSAFAYTAWLDAWAGNSASEDFLIVGDGILLAYKGTSKYVEIPNTVKVIAPACFLNHTEISDIKIPSSVTIIGEEAFKNCSSLNNVQGGSNVKEIQDRAFENTDITNITISASVEKIGIGAFMCDGGKERTVIFKGEDLPGIGFTERTSNFENDALTPVFSGNWIAVLNDKDIDLANTLFVNESYGFEGQLATKDELGNHRVFSTHTLNSVKENGVAVSCDDKEWREEEISVSFSASGKYHLAIKEQSKAQVEEAFQRVYGKNVPAMKVFDMTLWDATDAVKFTKLGENPVYVTVPLPKEIAGNTIHVAAMDRDKQLERLSCELINVSGKDYVKFSTNHFSTFAIYAMGEDGSVGISNGTAELTAVSGKKDYSPNTGDASIHPKWFAAFGMSALGVAFIVYKPKRKKKEV